MCQQWLEKSRWFQFQILNWGTLYFTKHFISYLPLRTINFVETSWFFFRYYLLWSTCGLMTAVCLHYTQQKAFIITMDENVVQPGCMNYFTMWKYNISLTWVFDKNFVKSTNNWHARSFLKDFCILYPIQQRNNFYPILQ